MTSSSVHKAQPISYCRRPVNVSLLYGGTGLNSVIGSNKSFRYTDEELEPILRKGIPLHSPAGKVEMQKKPLNGFQGTP